MCRCSKAVHHGELVIQKNREFNRNQSRRSAETGKESSNRKAIACNHY